MKRRDFLRTGAIASVGGLTVRTMAGPLFTPLLQGGVEDDRVLVIVQLYGGNDGLNTVIPIDQYSLLSGFRNNILIPEPQVLDLPGTGGLTGLHPAMGGMRDLWNDGKFSIVQGVGYPNPNFSHFRSTDIWETGADSNQVLDTGWAGRYCATEFPNYPLVSPIHKCPIHWRFASVVRSGWACSTWARHGCCD